MKKENILEVLSETAYAEHGSALEMLCASKTSEKGSLVYGYFQHAKDEYIHAKEFLKLLSKRAKSLSSELVRKYRFKPIALLSKGYVSRNGYLVETMRKKDFIAFVYTNELLAKSSFSKILTLVSNDIEDYHVISSIMTDELRHHGLAKSYFLKYFPFLQPWQLFLYKVRETVKNKGRIIYRRNLSFLEKIFYPVYSLLAYMIVFLLRSLSLSEFNRKGKNLMDIPRNSLL